VDYFIKTISKIGYDLTLDIYGTGDKENELKELIDRKISANNVSLKGFLSQKELFSILPEYDAGIAFVYDKTWDSIYSKAPSLKTLEYAAAGLPVIASKTQGHLDYMNRFGFRFLLFSNNFKSFCDLIKKIVLQGFNENDVKKNLECIKQFEWDNITKKKLFPLYENLAKNHDEDI
jgi:glycosyltransferase involved in cell wall biosynthesis